MRWKWWWNELQEDFLLFYGFGDKEDLKGEFEGKCKLDGGWNISGNKVDATSNGDDANGWMITQEKAYEIGWHDGEWSETIYWVSFFIILLINYFFIILLIFS